MGAGLEPTQTRTPARRKRLASLSESAERAYMLSYSDTARKSAARSPVHGENSRRATR
jgi:hypothetical protein